MSVELAVIEKVKAEAMVYVVENNIQRLKGYDELSKIEALKIEINTTFDPIIEKAHSAHKEAIAGKNKHIKPLEDAEKIIKGTIFNYEDALEKARIAEEARLQEIQRKEADKLAKKAEKELVKGNVEKSEVLQQQAEMTKVNVPVIAKVEKVKGFVQKTYWYAEVTDLMKLVKAVATGKVPITMIQANMPKLNDQASSLKDTFSYDGVVFKSRKGM